MSTESIEVDKHLYEVLTRDGLEPAIQFAQKRLTDELSKKGAEVTLELKEYIVKTALQEVKSLTGALRKHFLPPDLVRLFEIDSKKEAKRFAENDLVIKDSDFVELIFNAQIYGFHHRRMHKEFIPEELKAFNPRDIVKVDPETKRFTKEAQKAVNQLGQIFKTRKQLSVHLFQFGFDWHAFSSTQVIFLVGIGLAATTSIMCLTYGGYQVRRSGMGSSLEDTRQQKPILSMFIICANGDY